MKEQRKTFAVVGIAFVRNHKPDSGTPITSPMPCHMDNGDLVLIPPKHIDVTGKDDETVKQLVSSHVDGMIEGYLDARFYLGQAGRYRQTRLDFGGDISCQ